MCENLKLSINGIIHYIDGPFTAFRIFSLLIELIVHIFMTTIFLELIKTRDMDAKVKFLETYLEIIYLRELHTNSIQYFIWLAFSSRRHFISYYHILGQNPRNSFNLAKWFSSTCRVFNRPLYMDKDLLY